MNPPDNSVDRLLDTWIDARWIAGAAVRVERAGQTLVDTARGLASTDPPIPARVDHVWAAASVSKPLSTMRLMQLVEDGTVQLDQPVADIFPAFGKGLRRHIRIRHLVTHTSGLSDALPDKETFTRLGTAGALATIPLLFPPGTACSYNSAGFTLMGEIVSKASGLPWADDARRHLLEPLGMRASSFAPDSAEAEHIARVYDGQGKLSTWWSFPSQRAAGGPGGGLYTTLADLARFARACLQKGRGILKPETFAQTLGLQTPGLCDLEGNPQSFGLGWYLYRDAPEHNGFANLLTYHAYGHAGATGTWLGIDPAHSLVIILLANRVGLSLSQAAHMREQLVEAALELPSIETIPPEYRGHDG